MSSNPFDDVKSTFVVLVNAEDQHSIWPSAFSAPRGWQVVFGVASRAECLNYVDENWSDMRPRSLRDRMSAD